MNTAYFLSLSRVRKGYDGLDTRASGTLKRVDRAIRVAESSVFEGCSERVSEAETMAGMVDLGVTSSA